MDGWVADTVFGDFDGGLLKVQQVGRQFQLQQGNVIFMRFALLQHAVSPTTRGKRFGVVLFTHQMMLSSPG
jgi:predicted 2-oxoglutarate/Fe(II)-dependent dioxygenase YbiX